MRQRFGSRGGFIVFVCAVASLLAVDSASASRCSTGLISGGLKNQCPSVDDPRVPACPPGSTRTVYRLDHPFPLDGTMSSVQVASVPTSPCQGATLSVPFTSDSYMIGCWFPSDRLGCRTVKFLMNGSMCIHLADVPLGCGGESCESLSIEQVAISNAGAADRMLCGPLDTAVSCRSTRINRTEGFRAIFGGLCSTMNIGEGGDLSNACYAGWGAFGTFKARDYYDWGTGAFRMDVTRGRSTCGAVGACLGDGKRAPWHFTIIGVPDDRIPGNAPPCLDDPSGGCQAPNCAP